jgi:hypothetical protein
MQKRPDTDSVKKTELCIIRQVRLDVGPTDIGRDFAYALQRCHSLSHSSWYGTTRIAPIAAQHRSISNGR